MTPSPSAPAQIAAATPGVAEYTGPLGLVYVPIR